MRLGRRNRALSVLAGPNKSNFRGRGIDFEEVRNYQPGDDIRSIDWRVTARTGTAHTKLFREERERPVLVAVDQRSSMFFGSSHCFKSVLAAQLASLLAWSALDAGDRVGGLVFNDASHREIRPRRSRKTVLALLSQISAVQSHAAPGRTRATPVLPKSWPICGASCALAAVYSSSAISAAPRKKERVSNCSRWPSTSRSPPSPAATRWRPTCRKPGAMQ